MKKNKDYFIGSENIFADLGLPNPEERLAKAELALQINRLIKQRKLTQAAAAKLLGIGQPKVSLLAQGKLSGFSLARLFKFLNILGQDVTIKVTKTRPKRQSNVNVSIGTMKKSPITQRPFDAANTTAFHARKKNK